MPWLALSFSVLALLPFFFLIQMFSSLSSKMFKNHPVTLANFLRPCHVSSRGLPLVTGRQSTFALGCDYKPSGRQGHVTTTSDHVFEPVTWKGLSSCGEKRHPETELYQANSLKAFLDPECFRRKKSLVSVMSFSKPPLEKIFALPHCGWNSFSAKGRRNGREDDDWNAVRGGRYRI